MGADDQIDRQDKRLLLELRLSPQPVAKSTELADLLSITTQAVNPRMKDLVEIGLVQSMSVGSGVIYWLTDQGRRYVYESVSVEVVSDDSGKR